ncbi:MAG: DUF4258 domain-containing protein [Fervidobacterium sp.]|uniref:DUF4258 domain-containing protein n=1 Tax=Fervidobacterium gondwanense DSM 13020 TaxID=1121883 RepID=A0A1M7SD63_FERGO|nr:DUF4258 domain-containing protein [Fervidobacterium gondwanense]UXF01219.1 hypothetical protein IB67_06615 [Fervidobacterium riparium]SHN56428.1 hypothetical protein SAMN02745226_00770 [Fervidobacterium gondwanense DSM 13020]
MDKLYISLIDKEALLTPHVYERMLERGITLEELVEMLESKDSMAVMQKNFRIKVTNGNISAILQLSGSVLYIITVFRENKKKAH